jgi:LETM1 and EF-hand domain-containing protein 1, mitochondrial
MRATGLTKEGYRRQLAQWLDLSTAKAVPISLLIMSRAFTLEAPDPASALALSISAMDTDVVTEVMIEAASKEERETASYRAMKLESLERQNELIEQEHRRREEALKKKKAAEAAEVSHSLRSNCRKRRFYRDVDCAAV